MLKKKSKEVSVIYRSLLKVIFVQVTRTKITRQPWGKEMENARLTVYRRKGGDVAAILKRGDDQSQGKAFSPSVAKVPRFYASWLQEGGTLRASGIRPPTRNKFFRARARNHRMKNVPSNLLDERRVFVDGHLCNIIFCDELDSRYGTGRAERRPKRMGSAICR